MVFGEYFMREKRGGTFQRFVNVALFRYIFYLLVILAGSDGEDGKQHIRSCYICCLVNAEAYISILIIAQVYFLAQCNRANLLG